MSTPLLEAVESEIEVGELPPFGKPVLVRCAGARRLAYRDREGHWRDHFTGAELAGLVEVISF